MHLGKNLIKYCIKLCLTVIAVGLLSHIVGWGNIADALLETQSHFLLLMIVGSLGNRVVTAFAMHTLLGFVGLNVRTGRVFLANSLSALYALILPGDVIAASAKWADLSAATGRKSMILNAIIYNRLALMFPPLLLGGVALIYEDPFNEPVFRTVMLCFLLLTVVGAVFLYHPGCDKITDRILRAVGAMLPDAVASRIDMVIASLQTFRKISMSRHLVLQTISAGSLLIRIFVFVMATYAVGIEIPVVALVWIMALLGIVRMVPVSIDNIGVREGILVVILNLYGIAAEISVALGLIMFLNNLVFVVIGLGYQVALAMGWTRWHSRKA